MGNISSPKNIQTGSEAHTASYAMVTTFLFWGVKLTANPHLALRLKMSGAISLLPLYAFLAWEGTTFSLTQYNIQEDIPDSALR